MYFYLYIMQKKAICFELPFFERYEPESYFLSPSFLMIAL